MRYAIVDNSTLTAVSRIMGHAPVQNRYALDGDIAALENLVQAILFYDKLFFIDDYKKEFREQRENQFSFIRPLRRNEFAYEAHLNAARELTKEMVVTAQHSQIVDEDFRPFINKLQMNIVFTWRMASSVFWLTVSMLDDKEDVEIHRYSKLWQSISTQLLTKSFSDLNEEENLSDNIRLLNKKGKALNLSKLDDRLGIDSSLVNFASSMNWLALRTTFYTLAAQSSDIDVILHPIRHSFRINLLARHFDLDVNVRSHIVAIIYVTKQADLLSWRRVEEARHDQADRSHLRRRNPGPRAPGTGPLAFRAGLPALRRDGARHPA